MSQVERILQRRGHDDALELERVRARTIERLSAIAESDGTHDEADVVGHGPLDIDGGPPSSADLVIELGASIEPDRDADDDAAGARPPVPVMADPTETDPPELATIVPFTLPIVFEGPAEPRDPILVDTPDVPAGPASTVVGPLIASRSQVAATRPPIVVDGLPADDDTDADPAPEPEPAAAPDQPTVQSRATAAPATTRRRSGGSRRAGARSTTPATPTTAGGLAPVAAYCPYCAIPLDPPPVADRRCDRCRQRIVVRTVDDGRLVHLTEAAVTVFEAEQQRAADLRRWAAERTAWLDLARRAGAVESRVERIERATLTDLVVETARDLYLASVDQAVEAALGDDAWEVAAGLRRTQARDLAAQAGPDDGPGDEAIGRAREAAAIELRTLAATVRAAVVVSAGCCDACRADDGTVRRIAGELRSERLPHAACSAPPCACRWDFAPSDLAMVEGYLRRTARSGRRGRDPEPAS